MTKKQNFQKRPSKIASKLNYKISYTIALVVAIIFLLLGFISIVSVTSIGVISIILGLLFLYLYRLWRRIYKNYDYYKENGFSTKEDSAYSGQPIRKTYTFPVVGVTFKTGRQSRQTALRHIYFHDTPYETVDIQIKEYDYEGELALGVYANEFQVGNISRANINRVCSLLSDDYTIYDYKIYGGGDKSWGMSITLSKIVNS